LAGGRLSTSARMASSLSKLSGAIPGVEAYKE
jgi:hypothetical protein